MYSNDYFRFKSRYRRILHGDINNGVARAKITKKASVVIPAYNQTKELEKCLRALSVQNVKRFQRMPEVVIVVDGGGEYKKVKEIAKRFRKFPTKLLYTKINHGRSTARNLGILEASGEVIVFMDSDVVPGKDFLINHMLRHETIDKIAVIGMREDREYHSRVRLPQREANYKADFRFKKFIPKGWKRQYPHIPAEAFGKEYSILRESDFFNKFGAREYFGVWDLPYMFLTCNASVKRKHAMAVGGFDTDFHGWGMEDVHFGSKLINLGVKLVPVLSATTFHLRCHESSDQKKKKQAQFARNLRIYKSKKRRDSFAKNNRLLKSVIDVLKIEI